MNNQDLGLVYRRLNVETLQVNFLEAHNTRTYDRQLLRICTSHLTGEPQPTDEVRQWRTTASWYLEWPHCSYSSNHEGHLVTWRGGGVATAAQLADEVVSVHDTRKDFTCGERFVSNSGDLIILHARTPTTRTSTSIASISLVTWHITITRRAWVPPHVLRELPEGLHDPRRVEVARG